MKLKKIVARLVIIVGMVSLLGGCGMSKETLTKEQQDNVVKRIVRQYSIETIEFTKFVKDRKTGTYHLHFIINGEGLYETGLTVNSIERFNNSTDEIGLSPLDIFEPLKRDLVIQNISQEYNAVNIGYLKE